MPEVRVPAPGGHGQSVVFQSRPVPALELTRRLRRSVLDLEPAFGPADVISARLGRSYWHFGRSPEWARHVIGSRSMWADLDVLPLGLGHHREYYAMGGLPGAPPEHHRLARHTAVACFKEAADGGPVDSALAAATRLASSVGGSVDVRAFTRALFLRTTAAAIMGVDLDDSTLRQVLDWFDRWTAIMSNPLVVVGQPMLPFTPAGRLRQILAPWYRYLAALLDEGAPAPGLVSALRERVAAGMPVPEAVGYLATIMFAGTEPPAHTLMWAYAQCVAVEEAADGGGGYGGAGPGGGEAGGTGPGGASSGGASVRVGSLGPLDSRRTEGLMWESIRVQPAVNLIVRRISASPSDYKSESADTFVVLPPLVHRGSNQRRGLPLTFTPPAFAPAAGAAGRLDPDDYPGLGCGAHHCIGARFGIEVGSQALLYLLEKATVVGPPDLTPAGVITSQPRRLPSIIM